MVKNVLTFFRIITFALIYSNSSAQHDTSYFVTNDQRVTTRLFLSRKFTALKLWNRSPRYSFHYLPNTTLNLGVGATYKIITLNLAYGFGFLNPEQGRGKTQYLDLQTHHYGKKIVIDLFGQFYRGFYLSDGSQTDQYYVRPDMRITHLGASAHYVFNNRKFSYRSSFILNDWQKKSQGSFLAGLEIYAGQVIADSSLVPFFNQYSAVRSGPRNFSYVKGGPSFGYVFTGVIRKYYFFTISFDISANLGVTKSDSATPREVNAALSVNSFIRFVTGYNSDRWAFAFSYINDNVRLSDSGWKASIITGNLRATYAYKLRPGKKLKEILRFLNDT